MKALSQSHSSTTQNGNMLFIIFIGIALFAALSFAVANSLKSDTAGIMDERDAKLAATDILNYTSRVERAVTKVRGRGVSENDLSFDNNVVSGYAHGQPDTHKIFHPSGGGLTWQSPAPKVNDGSEWIITGSTCITDFGTGFTGCDSDSTANEELMLVLPNIKEVACREINKSLQINSIPTDSESGYSTTLFTGSFADGTELDLGTIYKTACYDAGGGVYHLYHALLER